jgi:hypothetical protein
VIVNPSAYLLADGVECITPEGAVQQIRYEQVKAVCFASENLTDLFQNNVFFERRPKMEGLWARFYFRDGDQLEGLLAHNILEWPGQGFLLSPPKAGAGRHRVFVPRLALAKTELLGVVGRGRARRPAKRAAGPTEGEQLTIFSQ